MTDFLEWLRKVVREATSTNDGAPDVLRIGGVLLGIQFLINANYDLFVLGNAFDPIIYSGGASALLVGIGGALRVARKPSNKE